MEHIKTFRPKKKINSNENCCVYGCKSVRRKNSDLMYHKVPYEGQKIEMKNEFGQIESQERRKMWEILLRMGKKITNSMKVCSLHFSEDSYMCSGWSSMKRLKLTAIPNQNLPTPRIIDNWDDFNSLEIKLEREEVVIKGEPEEFTEGCSPLVISQFKTNPSPCYVGNLVKNELKTDNYDDSQSLEIKLEQEELIIKDETNVVTEENKSFVIMSETNLSPLSIRNCIVKTEENMDSHSNYMKFEEFIIKAEPEEVEDGHNQIHTGDSKKPFKCQQCNQGFKHKWYLKRHRLIHEDNRPFNCQHCDKSFTQKDNLKTHLLVHDGKKPFECQQCNKSFKYKFNLKQHMLIHEDKRPFNCKQCVNSFRQKQHLNTHMVLHQDNKYFKCQQCNKSFRRNDYLKKHMVIHEDKKLSE